MSALLFCLRLASAAAKCKQNLKEHGEGDDFTKEERERGGEQPCGCRGGHDPGVPPSKKHCTADRCPSAPAAHAACPALLTEPCCPARPARPRSGTLGLWQGLEACLPALWCRPARATCGVRFMVDAATGRRTDPRPPDRG